MERRKGNGDPSLFPAVKSDSYYVTTVRSCVVISVGSDQGEVHVADVSLATSVSFLPFLRQDRRDKEEVTRIPRYTPSGGRN